MRRWPVLAFGGLAVATVAAFFIIQHLKVTTPLIAGNPAPFPTTINPLGGGTCIADTPAHGRAPVNFSRTTVTFWLLNRSDNVEVFVVNPEGRNVAEIASGVFMPGLPNFVPRTFGWNGRESGGRPAPAGRYYLKVVLRRQDRTVDITDSRGLPEWITVEYSSRCPGA